MNLNTNGTVTSPQGFWASGVTCGLKESGNPDMALLYSEVPCTASAAFTNNLLCAAPVIYDRQIVTEQHEISAVLINSGVANASTGQRGLDDAKATAQLVAKLLDVNEKEVLVSSTGRIGIFLPMDKIAKGAEMAAKDLNPEGGLDAARAIMTTDTVCKHCSVSLEIGGKTVTLGAMTKGAGMIAPQMLPVRRPAQATMLAYLTTDAKISREALDACLAGSLDSSFNRIIVDGDTSTNDTFVALANGLADNPQIELGTPEFAAFKEAFESVAGYLAKEMVKDGEGVSIFVEVKVVGAPSDSEARKIAETIARSPLCKTSWCGRDANWGRISCAVGNSHVPVKPEDVSIVYNDVYLTRNGQDANPDPAILKAALAKPELYIQVFVGNGSGSFTIWSCDLTEKYIQINAEYPT